MVTKYPRPSTGTSLASRRLSAYSSTRDDDEGGSNQSTMQFDEVDEANENILSIEEDQSSLNQSIASKDDDEGGSVIQVTSPRGSDGGSLKQSLTPRDEEGDGASMNENVTPRFGDGASINQGHTPRDGLGIILHQNMASEDEVSLNQSMSSRDQEESTSTPKTTTNETVDEAAEEEEVPAPARRFSGRETARSSRKISSAITANDLEPPAPVTPLTTNQNNDDDKGKAPVPSAQPEVVSESRNDKEPRQASLLLVGPKGAGKTTLVYRFLDRDEQPKPTLALDYTYGRKPGRVSMVKDVCHLWEVAGGTLQQLITTVISSCQLPCLTAIIVLDLSRPDHIFEELLSTLSHLKGQIQEAVKKASLEDSSLTGKLQKAAWARVGPEHPDRKHIDPLLVPLVILGGKYDKFQDFEPESKKVVCRALRYVAHTNGAALQFFSSRDAGLIKKAKELMSHFGFGTTEVKSLAQDYNRPLIIPCGSDSLSIIGGAVDGGPGMSVDGWKHAIMAKFPKSDSDKGSRTRVPEDPSKDENYREADIDNLRAQKDQELERLCREAGRMNQRYADLEL